MKKKLAILVISLIIIIISGIRAHGNWESALYNTDISTSAYENIGEMHDNMVIRQGFYSKSNGLSGFSIKVATYDRANNSQLIYRVRDEETGQTVVEGIINTEDLKDNSFNEISFSKISNSRNKNYVLEIQDDNAAAGNGIAFFKTAAGNLSQSLMVNDEEIVDQALVIKVITNRFNIEYFIVFIALIVYIILFIKLLNKFLK